MEKKWNTKWKKFVLIVFLIFVMCFGFELGHEYSSEGYIDTNTWTADAKGNVLNEISFGVDRGDYELTLVYQNEHQSAAQLQIVDMRHTDENNVKGVIVGSGALETGSHEITIPFTIEEGSPEFRLISDISVSITEWKLDLVRDQFTDNYLLFFIFLLVALVFFWKMNWGRPQYIYILLLISIFLSLPFLGTPLMETTDLRFHLSRIRGVAEGLASGQFPVRLNVDITGGYGFASEMMYPDLFIYIPAILYLLGVSLKASYECLILLINIGTALVGYYSFSRLLKSEKTGAVCAFLYMVNPYRLNNIFLRGAVGEVLAQIFFPLLFYALVEIFYRNYKKWWILVIAVTGILQSHILSLEYSALLALVFIVISFKVFTGQDGIKRLFACFKAAGTIVTINLWFLVPFLDQLRQGYVLVNDQRSLYKHAIYPYQMFFTYFNISGLDVPGGLSGEMPLTIGIVLLISSILFVYLSFGKKVIKGFYRRFGFACLIAGGVMCYMSSVFFLWKYLEENCRIVYSILAKIQYPFRLLGYALLFLCVVASIVVATLKKMQKREIAFSLLFVSALLAIECMDGYLTDGTVLVSNRNQYIMAAAYIDYYRSDFEENDLEEMIRESGQIIVDDNASIQIEQYRKDGVDLQCYFTNKDKKETQLVLPLYNYYLHEATLNGQPLNIQTGTEGRMNIVIPGNVIEGEVSVVYKGRIVYKVCDWISFFSIIGIIFFVVIKRYPKQRMTKFVFIPKKIE